MNNLNLIAWLVALAVVIYMVIEDFKKPVEDIENPLE